MRIIGQVALAYLLERAENINLVEEHQKLRERADARLEEARRRAIPDKAVIIRQSPPLMRVK